MDNIQGHIMPLFSSPVYINDAGIYDMSYLDSVPYHRTDFDDGFITDDKYILNSPYMKEIRNVIEDHIKIYTKDHLRIDGEDFYITNSWALKHQKGDQAPYHHHGNSIFSGVYYYDVKEKSGDIKFTTKHGISPFEHDYSEWNIFNSKTWSIQPKNGIILLFPSNITHHVEPNQEEYTRKCLAFNIFCRGILGKGTISELELK